MLSGELILLAVLLRRQPRVPAGRRRVRRATGIGSLRGSGSGRVSGSSESAGRPWVHCVRLADSRDPEVRTRAGALAQRSKMHS